MKFKIVKEIDAKNLKDALKNEAKAEIKYVQELVDVETKEVGY